MRPDGITRTPKPLSSPVTISIGLQHLYHSFGDFRHGFVPPVVFCAPVRKSVSQDLKAEARETEGNIRTRIIARRKDRLAKSPGNRNLLSEGSGKEKDAVEYILRLREVPGIKQPNLHEAKAKLSSLVDQAPRGTNGIINKPGTELSRLRSVKERSDSAL